MDDLLGRLGVRVVEEFPPHGWWGAYDHGSRSIYVRPTLAPLQRRSTLTHECAHAALGHTGHEPLQETVAEELAASWLIPPEDFDRVAKIFDTVQAVAHELNVLPRDVKAYCRLLEKEKQCAS